MSEHILCAANWKLHKDPGETKDFLKKFLEGIDEKEQSHFALFPPSYQPVCHLRTSLTDSSEVGRPECSL